MDDLFDIPAPAPKHPLAGKGINLRWYQREDCDALMHAIATGHNRPACIGATGAGKGAIIAEMAGRLMPDGKVVCLVDRSHLVHQLADEIERHLSNREVLCGRVADGECIAINRRIVVSTVQAMYTPDRSGKPLYAYPQFDETRAVLVDEGHKFFADVFRGVCEHFVDMSGAVVCGFTATPVAANGERWAAFWNWTPRQEGPCMRTARWCVNNGYLVPPRQAFVKVNLDLSGIYNKLASADPEKELDNEDGGDELAETLMSLLQQKNERDAAAFARGVVEVIGERRAVVFSPARVAAARLLASWIKGAGLPCEPVWGSRSDKADVLARFSRGAWQVLTNVNLLCEGWNDPAVSAVFLCRLLKQWRLAAQMVGRALRPNPATMARLSEMDDPEHSQQRREVIASSSKPDALIADLVGSDGKVLQASAVDVLLSEASVEERQEVGEIVRTRMAKQRGELPDIDEAVLEEARQQILKRQNEQLAEMARRRALELDADVSVSFTSEAPETLPPLPAAHSAPMLGTKAWFVAAAVGAGEDIKRALHWAEHKPAHVLRGWGAKYMRKGKPDWAAAKRAFPEWAALRKGR